MRSCRLPHDRIAGREDREQVADASIARERIGHRQLRPHRVAVPAADALPRHVAGVDELADDPVRGALGDPDGLTDVAQPHARVVRDADQDARVVRQERPVGGSGNHDREF